jgi:hypothetical protein
MGRVARGLVLVSAAILLVAGLATIVIGCGGDGGDSTDGGDDGGVSGSPSAAGEKTYTNADYGFSVTYDPQRFDIFEEIGEASGLIVVIADSSQTDGPSAIKISVGSSGPGGTVYEPGSTEAMAGLQAQFGGFKEDFAEADFGEPEECTLGGLPALCAYIGGAIPALPIDDPQLTARIYGTVWADKGMFVLVGAPSPIFGEMEPVLQEVVDSIVIEAAAD